MSYKYLITYKFGDDYVQSGDEMLYHCPFCPEFGKRNNDRKLYVNSKNGKYHCFRCDTVGNFNGKTSGLSSDIFKESGNAINEILNFINVDKCEELHNIYFRIPNKLLVDYPDTIPYKYMISRGFTPEMMQKYSLRAFGDDQFVNRIVIPNRIINNNWTDFYTCRAILDTMYPRYLNSKLSNKTEIVFNIDNIKFGEDIIVNEGCINSIIAGDNSVAILGKYASNNQILQIVSKEPRRIYISLDGDAKTNSLRLAKIFHSKLPSCEIRLVDLSDDKDAADLGRLNYLERIEDSEILYHGNFDIESIFEKFME